MNQKTGSPHFLTVDELADLLRVEKRTVYEWVSKNQVPYRKAMGRTLFLLEEIMAWTVPASRR